MTALVAERERGGAYRGIADLASRSGAARDGLERLAWAGALDSIAGQGASVAAERTGTARREALWRLGTLAGSARDRRPGRSWRCRWSRRMRRSCPRSGPGRRVVADYGSTGMTLGDHPWSCCARSWRRGRPSSRPGADRRRRPRSRWRDWWSPASARRPRRGSCFMLLEDETGTVNLIVPPPGLRALPGVVRTAPLLRGAGPPGAPPGSDQRGRRSGSPSSSGPTCRAQRCGTIEPPPGRETGASRRPRVAPSPSCAPSPPPPTASAAAAVERWLCKNRCRIGASVRTGP